jgi:glycosyltransferase involved in cell wall biosynthesis
VLPARQDSTAGGATYGSHAPPLRVALVQYRDARDVRNWSGTLSFSKAAIHRHVGPVVDLSPAPVSFLPFRVARKLVHATTGRVYSYDHDPALARYYGRIFSRRVARLKPDLVFSPSGSSTIAYLETEAPIVYFTDGPWSVIRDYYPTYRNVVARTERTAEELERRALEKAAVVLVSSEWAREAVMRDYGITAGKVHNLFIGANLPNPPAREAVLPRRRRGGPIRLLMIGVLWDIKGGDIAFETLLRLLDGGHDAELTVVGCTPPAGVSHPRLTVIPFLDKSVAAERERFERLWADATVFLLPSRAEAAGVVFCEAAAHALPVVATHTGGIPSLVHEGRNGFTLPLEARGEAYAARIVEMVADAAAYERLCVTSRDEFERRLNWDAWGRGAASAIAGALPSMAERLPAASGR